MLAAAPPWAAEAPGTSITNERSMMKSQSVLRSLFFISASALLAANSFAAKISDCGKRVPSKTLPAKPATSEYEAYRNAKVAAVAGPAGNTEFQNREGKLPPAGKNEIYYEYYLGNDGTGGAGSHRAVLLVQESKNKNRLLESYYTQDHYATFCSLNE